MTIIATASNPMFTVSRVDIDRGGPTYTIDTLRDLRAERPDAELFFITGADAVEQILDWKNIDELWSFRGSFTAGSHAHSFEFAAASRKLARSARAGDLLY